MPNTSVVLAAVAAGGALGACARYLLGRFLAATGFALWGLPLGTLAANGLGCFAAGMLMGWLSAKTSSSEVLVAFLMTGLLGGFTTFSAFSFETLRLAQTGAMSSAFLNVGVNLFVSLLGVVLGWQLIQALAR